MMEIINRIVYLLRKHVSHKLNEREKAELKAWADRDPAFQQLLEEVSDEKSLASALQAFDAVYGGDKEASITRMEARIAEGIKTVSKAPIELTSPHRFWKWVPYAAAMLITATAATWIFFSREIVDRQATIVNAQHIAPGTNRATLTLADGRTVDLNEAQTGIIVSEEDITYDNGTSLALPSSETLVLTTPKGGTYQVILPDGSKVWLNAASTLKYPSRFDGDERVVELEGEAYFDVSEQGQSGTSAKESNHVHKLTHSQKIPFKVVASGQTVEVLGTEFNISAYPDEPETKTTLVEGAVQIVNRQSKIVNKLQPGDQSIVREASTDIQKVDTEQYTAWKDGFFYFDRLPTKTAITQLARWYDLEVVYEGKVPKANIYGYIDRNKPLSTVLTALEKSGFKFKVVQSAEQRQLIVLGEQ